MMDMVEDIIDLDSKMRFAAVIDSKGKILEAIMKSGKLSLKSQKEEENFCAQVAARKKMREKFDKSLGKVRYVHVEREKVTQMVVYTKKYSVYFTMEPEMSISDKIRIVTKIKKMTSAL
ncbi:hypothetical protein C6988_06420 [Nitrosopumilus sp. b1]|uniref:DUF6659 family protein n=1 Tax=Nitrosopumilus sp. b1 TaxID=2109907 RepID=UPI000E2ADFA8|nr:DUF6659 family protein [Nitrosopumilus sp. b1]RDJ31111.1 MAG: hypothetical protein DWQ17_09120 [Thermoproteota archaeon]KAF6242812.1 hypothetical protein C6988_06420 [Nitrosopumilus sp. b1]RDJ34073.1 MAG: hypothetical protein DWQ18_04010 [Thermoproteota archaeon]RDJ36811.1 MAG: hypothetical protein DWQ13_06600 [Thermoproteota archaeon]RDJ37655.1 MAG: hypothetical protein DWQ19_04235 [Thermoproteota archaeon]